MSRERRASIREASGSDAVGPTPGRTSLTSGLAPMRRPGASPSGARELDIGRDAPLPDDELADWTAVAFGDFARIPARPRSPTGAASLALAPRADPGGAPPPVQMRRLSVRTDRDDQGDDVVAVARAGVARADQPLPHLDRIAASFGPDHDLGGMRASVGGAAAEACDTLGAAAYAHGDRAAFAAAPDLHTAAHEAAHLVQQRAGVRLRGVAGDAGDVYERHADLVADRVVRGQSAADLLTGGQPATSPAIQLKRVGVKAGKKSVGAIDVEDEDWEAWLREPDVGRQRRQVIGWILGKFGLPDSHGAILAGRLTPEVLATLARTGEITGGAADFIDEMRADGPMAALVDDDFSTRRQLDAFLNPDGGVHLGGYGNVGRSDKGQTAQVLGDLTGAAEAEIVPIHQASGTKIKKVTEVTKTLMAQLRADAPGVVLTLLGNTDQDGALWQRFDANGLLEVVTDLVARIGARLPGEPARDDHKGSDDDEADEVADHRLMLTQINLLGCQTQQIAQRISARLRITVTCMEQGWMLEPTRRQQMGPGSALVAKSDARDRPSIESYKAHLLRIVSGKVTGTFADFLGAAHEPSDDEDAGSEHGSGHEDEHDDTAARGPERDVRLVEIPDGQFEIDPDEIANDGDCLFATLIAGGHAGGRDVAQLRALAADNGGSAKIRDPGEWANLEDQRAIAVGLNIRLVVVALDLAYKPMQVDRHGAGADVFIAQVHGGHFVPMRRK